MDDNVKFWIIILTSFITSIVMVVAATLFVDIIGKPVLMGIILLSAFVITMFIIIPSDGDW